MALKFMVGASLLLAAGVAASGCQNSPPRTASPGFAQKQGSSTPPMVSVSPPPLQPNGLGTNGLGTPVNTAGPSGLGGIPTPAAPTTGSQFRSTAPYNPNSGPGSFGQNPATPAFGPSTGGPGFNSTPLMPPPN